jgi:hypothetical protein
MKDMPRAQPSRHLQLLGPENARRLLEASIVDGLSLSE